MRRCGAVLQGPASWGAHAWHEARRAVRPVAGGQHGEAPANAIGQAPRTARQGARAPAAARVTAPAQRTPPSPSTTRRHDVAQRVGRLAALRGQAAVRTKPREPPSAHRAYLPGQHGQTLRRVRLHGVCTGAAASVCVDWQYGTTSGGAGCGVGGAAALRKKTARSAERNSERADSAPPPRAGRCRNGPSQGARNEVYNDGATTLERHRRTAGPAAQRAAETPSVCPLPHRRPPQACDWVTWSQ
jgi:hypothetical protein